MVTEGNACGAISWYFVRFPGFFQEIATAFGLAMTEEVGRWSGFAGMHTSVQLLLPAPSVMLPCFAWQHDSSPTLTRRGAIGAASMRQGFWYIPNIFPCLSALDGVPFSQTD